MSLITSIAQGGGFNVQEESYEELPELKAKSDIKESRSQSLRIVRPLQDIGMKGRLQGFLDGKVFRLVDGMRHMHILILLAGNTTSSDIKWRQIV